MTYVNLPYSPGTIQSNAPTVSDDNTQGFSVGSTWIYNGRVWQCANSSTGAAVWTELTQPLDHPGYVANRYYSGQLDYQITTLVLTSGTVYYAPIQLYAGVTFTKIGCEVTAAGNGGSLLYLAIYSDGGGVPGSRMISAGSVAANTVSLKEITLGTAFSPVNDWYWLALGGVFGGGVTVRAYTSNLSGNILGRTAPSNSYASRVTNTGFTGTFPATAPTVSYTDSVASPYIWIRL